MDPLPAPPVACVVVGRGEATSARLAFSLLVSWPAVAAAAEARALNRQAWEAFRARDFAAAEVGAREAWSAAEADRAAAQAGVAAANVAAALAMRGRFPEALDWSARADERLGTSGAREARGRVAAARALILYASGERRAGARELSRASGLLAPDDWPLGFLQVAVRMYVELDLGRADEELKALLEKTKRGGDRTRTILCLVALGWAESFFGGPARERFQEAHDRVGEEGDAELRAFAAHDLGVELLRARDLPGAEAMFAEGLELARRRSDRRLQVILLNDLSLLHVQQDEDARARQADLDAQAVLTAIAEDLRQGRIEDDVLLDFRQLCKLRYLNLPPVLFPYFHGVFEQLALDPRLAAGSE